MGRWSEMLLLPGGAAASDSRTGDNRPLLPRMAGHGSVLAIPNDKGSRDARGREEAKFGSEG